MGGRRRVGSRVGVDAPRETRSVQLVLVRRDGVEDVLQELGRRDRVPVDVMAHPRPPADQPPAPEDPGDGQGEVVVDVLDPPSLLSVENR